MRTILTILFAFMASGALLAEEIPPEDRDLEGMDSGANPGFEVERFSWVGKVPTDTDQCKCTITVQNHFGTVRARFGGYEGSVEVFANVQHFTEEESRLIVKTSESPDGIAVTVGYPDVANGKLITVRDDAKKRADLVVWVPRGVPLKITTDQGLIDARGLKSDIQARSSSGDIRAIKIEGTQDFETSSGDIVTSLMRWDTKHDHIFTTGNGQQSINFGGEVDTRINVATNGLISSDYSMIIDYDANRQSAKQAKILIGKGLSTVTNSSANGKIRLKRLPLAQEASVQPETGN